MTYRTFDGTSQAETIVDGRFSSDGSQYIMDSPEKLNIGTGKDLSLYHNGTDSIIESNTNDLILNSQAGDDIFLKSGDDIFLKGEHDGVEKACADFYGNAGVVLYHGGLSKFQTESDGAKITGSLEVRAAGGADSILDLNADDASNPNDKWRLISHANNNFGINRAVNTEVLGFAHTTGNATFAGDLTISNTSPQLFLVDTNNDSDFEVGNEDGVFRIRDTSQNENRLEITSTGNATFTGKVSVSGGTTKADLHVKSHTNDWEGGLLLEDSSGSNNGWNIHPDTTSATAGKLMFGWNDTTSAALADQGAIAKFEIYSGGNCSIVDGDLEISSAGHGIDFSATSDATGKDNELLDDYEEGTWTPTIANGGWTSLGSSAVGHYTKIGNIVHIQIVNGELTGSGNSNTLQIGGLPFTVANWTPGSMYAENYNSEGNDQATIVGCGAEGLNTELRVVEWGVEAIGTDFGTGYFVVQLTYRTTD